MAKNERDVVGGKDNFWLYSEAEGYDLTHSPKPHSPPIIPRLILETVRDSIAIDPAKTALVVVDLQNYFLSSCIGRPSNADGLQVVDKLLKLVIPACRKARIPILWLNWGLTEQSIERMPPAIVRGFALDDNFDGPRKTGGLGPEIGLVTLEDGSVVDGGRVLICDQWNWDSYSPLKEQRQPQDMLIWKSRLSGFWEEASREVLTSRGIRTLMFAGTNTDQCVGGSLQDAFTYGFDCLLLSDACATTSSDFARKCIEFNTVEGWGFSLLCKDFVKGVDGLRTAPESNA